MTERRRPASALILGLASVLALAGCQQTSRVDAPDEQAPVTKPVTVHKSPNDSREYRYLVLENQMRVLLVSDADADKAAASLTVLRGSSHEPDAYPGLAHFLEHMLFIGTAKYPEVDGYQQFLGAHGGRSNAYTASDHTNYFFDVAPDYLQESLDRFAQFFISPLLAEEYVEREKKAVASEYQMQFKADNWRVSAAQKRLMNPRHPASRFSIGSLETLGDGIGDALEQWYAENYSADQMALAVVSPEPLDALEAWVTPMFEAVENRNIGPAVIDEPMFSPGTLPATLSIQPLKEIRSVSYDFPVPSLLETYREKPDMYVTNLLGHEGPESLYTYLKDAGWIESLSASSYNFDNDNSFVTVEMELTASGEGHIEDITTALFEFIERLRTSEPDSWRYEEQARVAELGFRFQEPSSPMGLVYRASPNINRYAPEDLLQAPYLMERFDPAAIKTLLGYLTPENLLLIKTLPDADTDSIEPWFEVPYAIENGLVPADGEAPQGLDLPAANPFLPASVDLVDNDPAAPSAVIDRPGVEIWLDTDTSFGGPRANLYLELAIAGGNNTADDAAAARVYTRIVRDELNAFTYPAYLAGLTYSVSTTTRGFLIRTAGYTDKQPELLDAVLTALAGVKIDAVRFARFQAELVREWRNFDKERPYTQSYDRLGQLMMKPRWARSKLADALEAMDSAALTRWQQQNIGRHSARGLWHGNVTATDVAALEARLASRFELAAVDTLEPSVTQVHGNYRVPVSVSHDDASMVLFMQDPDADITTRARSALAVNLLRQAYFTDLRTEQQLGYIVSAVNTTFRNQAGVGFVVQSPVASPRQLEAATQDFLDAQISAIGEMTPAQFEANKAGMINEITQADQNLNERSSRYWRDLELGFEGFDSNQQLADAVAGFSQAEMLQFITGLAERARNARIVVYSLGKFDEAPEEGQLVGASEQLSG